MLPVLYTKSIPKYIPYPFLIMVHVPLIIRIPFAMPRAGVDTKVRRAADEPLLRSDNTTLRSIAACIPKRVLWEMVEDMFVVDTWDLKYLVKIMELSRVEVMQTLVKTSSGNLVAETSRVVKIYPRDALQRIARIRIDWLIAVFIAWTKHSGTSLIKHFTTRFVMLHMAWSNYGANRVMFGNE